MFNLLLIFSLLMEGAGTGANSSVIFQQTYEKTTEEMVDPHFFDYSPQGELFVVERRNPKIHRWSKHGKYLGSFSKSGQGPGELSSPQLLHATETELWVWDRPGRRYSLFTHDGKFLRNVLAIPGRIRRFSLINDKLILVGLQIRDALNTRMEFHLTNHKGKTLKIIKSEKNEMFLNPVEGDNMGHVKVYGPELDIYTDKKGTTWFGFSQDRTLYRMDDQGEVVETINLKFPTAPPSDLEIDAVKRMSFSSDSGKTYSMKTMPGIRWNYSYDKAYYTHLAFAGDKLAAVLTPISGTDQLKGYYEGSYTVMEFKDHGEPLETGRYSFDDTCQLYYHNGHMVGIFLNDEDEYVVKSFSLRGL